MDNERNDQKKPAPKFITPKKPGASKDTSQFETLAMSMQAGTPGAPMKPSAPSYALKSKTDMPSRAKDDIEFIQRKPQKETSLFNENLAKTLSDRPNLAGAKDLPVLSAPTLQSTRIEEGQNKVSPGYQFTIPMNPKEYLGEEDLPRTAMQPRKDFSVPQTPLPSTVNIAATLNMGQEEYLGKNELPQTIGMDGPGRSSQGGDPKKDPYSLLGSLLVGKYEMIRFLGQGGMGAVYLARHKVLNKDRAIKFLPKTSDMNPTVVKRFIHEARAAARVEHPNIVQVYDIEETQDFYFIIMEYIKGQGVDHFLEKEGTLSDREAIKIIKPSAVGLSAIHEANMVHRDIKPANLMITETGQIKIADFGIVKDISGNTALTGAGTIIGTPQFMSPEQIKNEHIDHRSDIYSLGATFYFLLTGKTCFSGTAMQLMYQILHNAPIPPHEINTAVPESLSSIVLKMMEKEPEERYLDMGKVVEVLENYEKRKGAK